MAPRQSAKSTDRTDAQVFEMATSRSLFALEPHSAHDDHDQLARMAQLLGDFPPALIAASAPRARAHFTKDGSSLPPSLPQPRTCPRPADMTCVIH